MNNRVPGRNKDNHREINLRLDIYLQKIMYRKATAPHDQAKDFFDFIEYVIMLSNWHTAE